MTAPMMRALCVLPLRRRLAAPAAIRRAAHSLWACICAMSSSAAAGMTQQISKRSLRGCVQLVRDACVQLDNSAGRSNVTRCNACNTCVILLVTCALPRHMRPLAVNTLIHVML